MLFRAGSGRSYFPRVARVSIRRDRRHCAHFVDAVAAPVLYLQSVGDRAQARETNFSAAATVDPVQIYPKSIIGDRSCHFVGDRLAPGLRFRADCSSGGAVFDRIPWVGLADSRDRVFRVQLISSGADQCCQRHVN